MCITQRQYYIIKNLIITKIIIDVCVTRFFEKVDSVVFRFLGAV